MNYKLASSTWDERELASIAQICERGMFTMGDEVKAFEAEFAVFHGSKYCVMVNSGSSANLLMVAALRYRAKNGLNIGDEIIVPAVSWSTTYHPLYQYGLKLKFVDIDRHTLNYDISKLKSAISSKTKAIMAVNLLGNPNDFKQIEQIISDNQMILLEDNCESLGARFEGKLCGTFGLMGTYSSFFSHHISTMEGGLVVTDDEELYHILLSLRAHGWTRNLPKNNKLTGLKSDIDFEESFRFVLPGYNLRPLEMSGAIGRIQLQKLPQFIIERRANAKRFMDLMGSFPHIRTQQEMGESSWFGFSMVLTPDAPYSREGLINVFRELSIDVRPVVAGNFAKNDVLKWYNYEISGSLDCADEVDRMGMFVGNHHFSLESEFELLEKAINIAVQRGE